MGKISVFTMGHTGVVLDPNTLEPGVPLDALEIAQNAVQDPKQGHGGAVRKRPGLARFNTEYAGGVILGGIPMPVAGFGGAPTAGGGATVGTGDADDGTSVGTGDMTGAAGATFDGGAIATTPPGAGIFGGGSLFSGARLVVVGKFDNTGASTGGVGWYVGPKSLTENAIAAATPAQASVYAFPPNATFANSYGKPSCIDTLGTTGLYYAGNIGSQVTGLTAPTIYRTDGGTNAIIATIPRSTWAAAAIDGVAGSAIRNAIVDMHWASDGNIYICVKDKYTGQNVAGSAGRVFRLRPSTGELTEWNLGTTPGPAEFFAHVPYASYYFDGKLYVGTFPDAIDESAQLYASNGTNAASEGSFTVGGHNIGFISCFQEYNGRLFMGTGDWDTTPTHAQLLSRRPGDFVTAWVAIVTATGGAATSGNYFVSMALFGDALYASWYGNNGSATVYKIVADAPGDPLSSSFTTSSVLTSSNNPFRLWADDGVLYAIAEGDTATPAVFTSTDGTTWTSRAGRLPNFGAAASARNIFFGLNQ